MDFSHNGRLSNTCEIDGKCCPKVLICCPLHAFIITDCDNYRRGLWLQTLLLPWFLWLVWASGFQISVHTCHLGTSEKCSFLGFAAKNTDWVCGGRDRGGAGGQLVQELWVRCPSRCCGWGWLAGCTLRDNSLSILATLAQSCLRFLFFEKKKKGKKKSWLTAAEHETSETRARLITQPHGEKKYWTSRQNESRLYV